MSTSAGDAAGDYMIVLPDSGELEDPFAEFKVVAP